MRLHIELTDKNNCYVSLPREYLQLHNPSQHQGIICTPIKITTMEGRNIFLGYDGSVSSKDHTIEINKEFAIQLDLSAEEPVQINVVTLYTTLNKLTLKAINEADYQIVTLRRYQIEGLVLNNIQVIYSRLRFPLYYQQTQFVLFTVEDDINQNEAYIISNDAEISILLDLQSNIPQEIMKKKDIEMEILPCMEGFNTFIRIPQGLHNEKKNIKLFYSKAESKIYKHFSNFMQKYKKSLQNQNNKKKDEFTHNFYQLQGIYAIIDTKIKAPGQNYAIENNLAMLFKIKPQKQYENIICQIESDDKTQIRQCFLEELLQPQCKILFTLWNLHEGSQLCQEKLSRLMLEEILSINHIIITSRIVYIQQHYFLLTIQEENLTQETKPLKQLKIISQKIENFESILHCLKKRIEVKHISESSIPDKFILKCLNFVKANKKAIDHLKNKDKLNQILFWKTLNENSSNEILKLIQTQQKQVFLVNGNYKQGLQMVKKWIKLNSQIGKVFTIDFNSFLSNDLQNNSIGLVIKYIEHIFSINKYDIIIIQNAEFTLKNTDQIDFQQSYMIMISNVIAKQLVKLINFKLQIKIVFLNGGTQSLNKIIKKIINQTINLERPSYKSRQQAISKFINKQEELQYLTEQSEGLAYQELLILSERYKFNNDFNYIREQVDLLKGTNHSNLEVFPTFKHVGGFIQEKEALLEVFQMPILYDFLFEGSGVRLPRAVMLYGPPGCGKTYLARAISNQLKIGTISVKGPELLDKYIGGSEQKVRELFEKATSQAPCLIFFDEFDSIVPVRSSSNSGVTDRVVNQFLCYLDGVEDNLRGFFKLSIFFIGNRVLVLAATSRPDLIDPALLRPGRIERHIELQRPNKQEIIAILQIYQGPLQLEDVSLEEIAQTLYEKNATQADIVGFMKESRIKISFDQLQEERKEGEESIVKKLKLTKKFLKEIISDFKPSLSDEQHSYFKKIYERFKKGSGPEIKQQKQALQ